MNVEIFETKERLLADNDSEAEKTRLKLRESGTFFVNLMGSPGAGKTSVLLRLLPLLSGSCRIGVMEADIASDVDAETIEALGAKSIQVHTGGCCHMDAAMTRESLENFDTDGLRIIFLENVGNLICPAEFDTGAHRKVMILSLPEGDDKPLKYPLMFQESDVLLITKTDAAPYFDFDLDAACRRAKALNPDIEIFPVSAKTGEGMDAWEDWLLKQLKER